MQRDGKKLKISKKRMKKKVRCLRMGLKNDHILGARPRGRATRAHWREVSHRRRQICRILTLIDAVFAESLQLRWLSAAATSTSWGSTETTACNKLSENRRNFSVTLLRTLMMFEGSKSEFNPMLAEGDSQEEEEGFFLLFSSPAKTSSLPPPYSPLLILLLLLPLLPPL